ncbi:hypothetical protein RF11_14939 [Thelohanellus kitauei]|uniref:Transcription factor IIIC subunit 5 HTH domain-containing protein n=1 Tax=Thelohanellus kitauei TaxID=669202 RepID=A0A0C2IZ27_THEKT|nr:hypothetical protein RF11_14939 [Thelohanellus kitauei]
MADFQVKSDPQFTKMLSTIFGTEYTLTDQKLAFAPKEFSRTNGPHKLQSQHSRIFFEEMLKNSSLTLTSSTDYFSNNDGEIRTCDIKTSGNEHVEQQQIQINEIFRIRPVCSKDFIISHASDLTTTALRTILPTVANYIGSGPFKQTWCLHGVDPSTDKSLARFSMF